jgi:multisubunit Na+/H+ antiporter MnhB subunit
MSTTQSSTARARQTVTPSRANIGKSIKLVGLGQLLLVMVSFILLMVAVIYNYVKKTTDGSDDENKKKKVVGGLTIAALVFLTLTAAVTVWETFIVSKAVKEYLA